MNKTMTLSKSKLMAYRQCPKRLWLEVHDADSKADSADAERAFRVGHDVGAAARQVYDPQGGGVLIDWRRDGFARAIERSAELMRQDKPVFEAAFSTGQALAQADVMLPLKGEPGNWKMIEVKSSTGVKDYHYDDAAIQMYIANAAGVNARRLALAHVDARWVYPGGRRYQGLFREVDMTDEAHRRGREVKRWIEEGRKIIARATAPEIAPGAQCDTPYRCGFYDLCNTKKDAEFPVRWLPYLGRNKALRALIDDRGVEDMREAPDEMLSARQKRVKDCTVNNRLYADYAGAQKTLGRCEWPAYFLDFETVYFAVPVWAGTRPYQQRVFQYSLHRLDDKGDLRHREWLDLSGDDPSRALAEALARDCGDAGPVFVYSAAFEKRCIHELAERFDDQGFDDLAAALRAINERIVDLLPVMRAHYYHPAQEGSFSIKSVLPTIAPELDYATLEGVQDGGMAMDAYAEAIHPDTPAARKRELEQQLRRYCERDTFAMVCLWRFLRRQTPTENEHA